MATPACCRICDFVNCIVSKARSASRMTDSAAATFSIIEDTFAVAKSIRLWAAPTSPSAFATLGGAGRIFGAFFFVALWFSPVVRMIGAGVPVEGGAVLNPITSPALIVVGAILALVYEKSGSLWVAVLVHGLFNSAGVLAVYGAIAKGIPLT